MSPVVTTTSIILSSNKIQNGDIPAHLSCPGKWLLNECHRRTFPTIGFCLTALIFQKLLQVRPGPPPQKKKLWRFLRRDFYRPDAPSCHPTNSIRALNESQLYSVIHRIKVVIQDCASNMSYQKPVRKVNELNVTWSQEFSTASSVKWMITSRIVLMHMAKVKANSLNISYDALLHHVSLSWLLELMRLWAGSHTLCFTW